MDDMISSGHTILRAATACKQAEAHKVYGVATHGVFSEDANKILAKDEIDEIIVTDSIYPVRLDENLIKKKITVLSIVPLLARAIKNLHTGGSIVDLLEMNEGEWPIH